MHIHMYIDNTFIIFNTNINKFCSQLLELFTPPPPPPPPPPPVPRSLVIYISFSYIDR